MVKLLLWRALWPGETVLKLNWRYSVLSKHSSSYSIFVTSIALNDLMDNEIFLTWHVSFWEHIFPKFVVDCSNMWLQIIFRISIVLQAYARVSSYSPKGKETNWEAVFWKWKAYSGTFSYIRRVPPVFSRSATYLVISLSTVTYFCSLLIRLLRIYIYHWTCITWIVFSERCKYSCRRRRWGRGGHRLWWGFWRWVS